MRLCYCEHHQQHQMEDKYKELLKWGEENNIKLNDNVKVQFISPTMGYGFKTTATISPGTSVVSVPYSCLLSYPNSRFSKLVDVDQILGEFVLDSMQYHKTYYDAAIALMFEKSKSDSFFLPYLSILPSSFDTPMFWKENEIAEFENTCIEDTLDLDKISNDFNDKIQVILDKVRIKYPEEKVPIYKLEEYKQALSVISSRAFQSEDGSPYLGPVIDMLNSKLENNVEVGTLAGNLCAKMSSEVQEGEQIFNTYGSFCNSELLRKYGYIEEENEHNEVHIDIEDVNAVCSELFGELSETRLENYDLLENSENLILRKFSPDDVTNFLEDVRKVAELLSMDDEDFQTFKEMVEEEGKEKGWKEFHEQSGGMEMKQVRGIALLVLGKKLSCYPSSLSDDQSWLSDNNNNNNNNNSNNDVGIQRKKLALKLRIAEKNIIVEWMKNVKGEETQKRKGTSKENNKGKKRK